jgi:hypothetical protein
LVSYAELGVTHLCRDSGYAEATPVWTRLSWSGRLHVSGRSA